MRLSIFLTIVNLLNVSAIGFSQTEKFTINIEQGSIKEVLAQIEQESHYKFLYRDNDISDRVISVKISNQSLDQILNFVLGKTGSSYRILDNNLIVIVPQSLKQQIKVTGKVTDSSTGETLIGVNIVIEGTTIGTTTDLDGNFSIEVPGENAVLVVSYVGYLTENIQVSGRSVIDVTLTPDITKLDEVVVTALGIKKEEKALTYNVQRIDAKEVSGIKTANFMSGLTGKVAGVTINTSSSGIGGSARVVMRGTKSISGNNNALYVVDGIPLPSLQNQQPEDLYTGMGQSGDGIALFNPDDIESISVLSGATAAALYGSDAANGVVMITTKKGSEKGLSVSVSNSSNFYSPFVMPKFQNEYGSETGSYYSWGDKLETPSSYDPKDFFQTGFEVNNSLSISTGTEKSQSYLSISNVTAEGIIKNNNLDRYTISIRNSNNLLNDKLNVDLSAMYMGAKEQNMLSQGQYFNPLIPIYLFPRGDDIRKYQTYERYDIERNFKTQYWPYGDMGLQMQNPWWITNRDKFNNQKDRYLISGALKYDIKKWINVTGRAKLDYTTGVNEKKYYASTAGLFAGKDGAYYKDNIYTRQTYADFMVNVNQYFNDFSLVANLGTSVKDVKYNYSTFGGNLISVPNLFVYDNLNTTQAKTREDIYHDQTFGVFATAQIGWKSMIYADLTARNDWVSALAYTKSNSIFYPTAGVSAILTNLFPIKSDVLSYMKIRFSYSEVGNAPQRFISHIAYPLESGYPVTTTYKPNEELEPEQTKSYELGLQTQLFEDKIKFDLSVYKTSTYNQLFNPTISATSGYTNIYVNGGQVDNKGIEATLNLKQEIGKVVWNSTLVYSLNRNKIVKLLDSFTLPDGEVISMDQMDMGGTGSCKTILKEGESMGDIYVNTLKTDEHGYIDVDYTAKTVTADPNHFVYAGNVSPKYTLGWRNNFNWKGLDFGFLINARVGGVGVSITQALMDAYGVSETSAAARDAGGVLVNGFQIPAESYYTTVGGGTDGVGSMYVYSATNVRLAELTIGYDIPVKKYLNFIQSLNVSLIGRNLFMFYNKAPYDPELTASTGTYFQGIDYFMQPSLRNIGFSVKLRF